MNNSVQSAISYGLRSLGYSEAMDAQRRVIEAYMAGRDVLMVAPIGSGKSLIFQIAPFVFDHLRHGERENISSVCIVVAPLLSLMHDQVDGLRSKGISAVCLDAETPRETVDSIRCCEFNLVFCSPESIMKTHRKIFRGPLKHSIDLVVVDESHCIVKW